MPFGSHPAGLTGAALRVQTDERLALLTGEGHQRAFEELVRRHRAPLVAYACAFVGFHQSEDVVQEAFARLHTALAGGEGPMQVRPWLYAVARNRALTLIRDERQHDQLDENYDGVPQPPEIAMRHEELSDLVAQIKGLPRSQREALVQREMEGRSHGHIGASLGVSATSARGLIFRARTTLRSAAGFVIPLPLLRALLETEPVRAAGVTAAGSGGAAGLAGGSAAVLAVKGAAVLAGVTALLAGPGMVFEHDGPDGVTSEAAAAGVGARNDGNPTREHDGAGPQASRDNRNGEQTGHYDGPERPDAGSRKPGAPDSPSAEPTAVSEATVGENADEPSAKAVADDVPDDEENEETEDDIESGNDTDDGDVDDAGAEIDEELDPDELAAQSSPGDEEN